MPILMAPVLVAAASAAALDVIKIGGDLPMSGPNVEYGESFEGAAKLAVEHANADKTPVEGTWTSYLRTTRRRPGGSGRHDQAREYREGAVDCQQNCCKTSCGPSGFCGNSTA